MNISRSEFIALVKEHVGENNSIDNFRPTDRLSDLGIDSLGFATLLWAIEDKLKIQVDDKYLESLNGLTTLDDLVGTFKAMGHNINLN